ncbi:MAG: hypothetical protein AB7P00_33615, partial [Sandaracinaceae bacterium]
DGEDGARLLDPAAGGRRGGNLYGADGADSGGGTRDEGNIGGSNTGGSGNGGGGGGGVGCVVLRSREGTLPGGGVSQISGRNPSALMTAPILTR